MLKRKTATGMSAREFQREKRLGEMAWQMNFSALKLQAFRGDDPSVWEHLQALHKEAKREYDRLKSEIKMEASAADVWVFPN